MSSLETTRILVNSLPKSGTHLLAKAVKTFGYQDYFTSSLPIPDNLSTYPKFLNHRQALNALKNEPSQNLDAENTIGIGSLHLCQVTESVLENWLSVIPQGYYLQGHIPENAHLSLILNKLNYRHLMIIRDPRAVIASLIPFITQAKNTLFKAHFLEADFIKMSLEQRFDFILKGGYAEQADLEIEDFKHVYRSFYQWKNHPNCLLLRFEDLIGEQGGGKKASQHKALIDIAHYLDIELKAVESHASRLFDPTVTTFRIGKIDSWKETLAPKLINKLTDYCEPLCQELGYSLSI